MHQFVKLMKALSDPGRVKIVKMLGLREMCVCELTPALGLAQPTVSKHLKVLEEAGLVAWRKEGAWVIYRLPDAAGSPYVESLLGLLREWLDNDPDVAKAMGAAQGLRREDLCRREADAPGLRK